jgi:Fe-Mn family superoxide dismutase
MTLPFEYDALEPMMSKETLIYHHDKHHQAYVNKLNELIIDTDFEDLPLRKIIKESDGAIFNNAAQVYNHDFFWKSLNAQATRPSSRLENTLTKQFGSLEGFKSEFLSKAAAHFGSGWVWLVTDKSGVLKILATGNAQTPITQGFTPLLTCDVWEHAYYIDYRNVRPEYLQNYWKLVNWNFVSENYEKTKESELSINDCNDNSEMCEYVESLIEEERTTS